MVPTPGPVAPRSAHNLAQFPVACSCCTPGHCPIIPTTVIPAGRHRTEALTGCAIERAYVDKGYRGHDTQNPVASSFRAKRGVFGAIKRKLRRRSAIEPIIGHLKAEGHLGRCYLKGRAGDAANVVLSAVGHNFRRILAWLRELLCLFLIQLSHTLACPVPLIRLLNRLTRMRSFWSD
jgi:hypothetical protein